MKKKIKQLGKEIEELRRHDRVLQNSLATAGHREFDYITRVQDDITEKIEQKQKEIKQLRQ